MAHYNKTYTRNSQDIDIQINTNTGTTVNPDGTSYATHSIVTTYNSGDSLETPGIKTEDLVKKAQELETMLNELADGVINSAVDAALLNNGYTYTP